MNLGRVKHGKADSRVAQGCYRDQENPNLTLKKLVNISTVNVIFTKLKADFNFIS
jgi:hypothetical protein